MQKIAERCVFRLVLYKGKYLIAERHCSLLLILKVGRQPLFVSNFPQCAGICRAASSAARTT